MMFLLFVLTLSPNGFAKKIVYEIPEGRYFVELQDSGRVQENAQIIWDERIHGPLPQVNDPLVMDREDYEVPLFEHDGKPIYLPLRNEKGEVVFEEVLDEDGKQRLTEEGKPLTRPVYSTVQATETKYRLKVNAEKQAAKAAKLAEKAAKEAQEESERVAFQALKDKINADTATATDIRRAFKHLLKKLRE